MVDKGEMESESHQDIIQPAVRPKEQKCSQVESQVGSAAGKGQACLGEWWHSSVLTGASRPRANTLSH